MPFWGILNVISATVVSKCLRCICSVRCWQRSIVNHDDAYISQHWPHNRHHRRSVLNYCLDYSIQYFDILLTSWHIDAIIRLRLDWLYVYALSCFVFRDLSLYLLLLLSVSSFIHAIKSNHISRFCGATVRTLDLVLGSTPGLVAIKWLLLEWVTVCGQVNHLGI